MNKPLKPTLHGVLDYVYAAFLFFAPVLFNFTGTVAATVFYFVGTFHAGLSLLTAYPLGVIKAIPFPVHAGLEIATAVFLMTSPWLFGFAGLDSARITFLFSGLGLAGVWLLTDYQGTSTKSKIQPMSESEKQRKAA